MTLQSLDITSISFFFSSFGISSDTDHVLAAKPNQVIMACINILSRVAKCLYLHTFFFLFLIKCSSISVQRCAVGPLLVKREHYLKWENITPKKSICHVRHFSIRLLGLTSIICPLPGWYVVMF